MLDFHPEFMIKSLLQSVISINNQAAISNSVDEKLDRVLFALEYLNENIDVLTVHHLRAFIEVVNSQRTSKLNDTQADMLVQQADTILSQIAH
jgi:hypothetical protein